MEFVESFGGFFSLPELSAIFSFMDKFVQIVLFL